METNEDKRHLILNANGLLKFKLETFQLKIVAVKSC